MKPWLLHAAWVLIGFAAMQNAAAQTAGDEVPSTAAQLGRLFFTPAERLEIERARALPTEIHTADIASQRPEEIPPNLIRFDGIAYRQARPTVIWINGRPLEEQGQLFRYRMHIDAGRLILTDEAGQRFRLSVGQLFEMDRGVILGTLPPNAIEAATK